MRRSLATFVAVCLVNLTAGLRPPMLPLAPTLIVSWEYQLGTKTGTYRDVLETSDNPDGPWEDVPGPYSLNMARNCYLILVPAMKFKQFFRVRRNYGVPNVIPLSVDKRK